MEDQISEEVARLVSIINSKTAIGKMTYAQIFKDFPYFLPLKNFIKI